MKKFVSIRDNSFGHVPISNSPTIPLPGIESPIEWDRTSPVTKDTIYTDEFIRTAPEGARIWLIEPNPPLRRWVRENQARFSEVWTCDREDLEEIPHARLLPHAGCWIAPSDRRIWPKSRGVSTIASIKRGAGGYNLRHLAIRAFPQIDAYGTEYTQLPGVHHQDKIAALRDYRFHLVIENCRRDYFFTDKLIDCFVTGTIPIYWGCPSIGDFFNTKGMIQLPGPNPLEPLGQFLATTIWCDAYGETEKAIAYNFERAKKYVLTEDTIASHLIP